MFDITKSLSSGKAKRLAEVKRLLNPKDSRLKSVQEEQKMKNEEKEKETIRNVNNAALGPPYQILVDANFINFSIQKMYSMYHGLYDCLVKRVMQHKCYIVATCDKDLFVKFLPFL
ncbi:Fcf1-domain-containing protein [Gigaspora margarita]|uniref:Fcf1-domain-containing protein n=1 Tax=Gigaspora margarita TaxID=4874 RepID=A0A8H3WWQ2_GIGMA|nr:Fcf1-domain-containing protein [Gigaspora margarita]